MRSSYLCKICGKEMTRKWNYQRHLKTIHGGKRFPDNPGLTSFDYQHNSIVPNINRKILPDHYKNTTRLPINNIHYPPYHSYLKPNHQSNSTMGSYSDFDTKRN